ncbi:MAG: ribosome biogenesis GTP-binding protein [Candidatus Phytoplasma cynodontis]|uniref:ribosome biogenesis GTP-binding protein YihA/YsxC n=1 Tax='Cynodon dactylon' phytoplasma TaxID=295320 RepID=UPI001265C2A3|nr:ribosome biogenesis GTP-binding protein YihA/YsxC ['Cynodon dactylon' phytoplasma]KAB8121771.1 ribosome biogenesis GTP-binding protein YsxC ['Cynodon dactylon' phytoplasma]WIA07843.1 MAG: ribosome biogenesis GTP-binding protein [Candidatus Phytoplasma cynodontis]
MIKKSLFVKSVSNYKNNFDPSFPEILLIGRSNVGKSTFVNLLTNRKKLSFVSKKPGKTICLNYFLLNDSFYLIDSPGYGFQKKIKLKKNMIFDTIDILSKTNFCNKIIFQLMDFQIGPTLLDLEIYKKLVENNLYTIILFNKKDKVNKNQVLNQIKKNEKIFLSFNLSFIPKFFIISCKKNEGIKEVQDIIKSRINSF